MNRTDIAIAEDLLNNDVLDENNFSYDTVDILEYVQNIILEHIVLFPAIWHSILSIKKSLHKTAPFHLITLKTIVFTGFSAF